MQKLRVLFFVLLLPQVLSLTDKQIIQTVLNGVFEQNQLLDPITIVPCLDDDTAHQIVVFTAQQLTKSAKGSISDLWNSFQLIWNYPNQHLPQPVKECLRNNEELKSLSQKYGIDYYKPDYSTIYKKTASYLTLHYTTVHKWLGLLLNQWNSEQFNQGGFDAAMYMHIVLSATQDQNSQNINQE